MHTADSHVNEGWFSCDQMIIWMCFVCLLAKQCLSEKMQFLAFCSTGSAEALVMW